MNDDESKNKSLETVCEGEDSRSRTRVRGSRTMRISPKTGSASLEDGGNHELKIYEVTTMGKKILIYAKDRFEAYARFFLDIKQGKYPLDKIGGIIMVKDPDDGEEYPFRTTPTLWLMELIPAGVAFATIERMLDLDSYSDESADILIQSCKTDEWILDKIQILESSEFKEEKANG